MGHKSMDISLESIEQIEAVLDTIMPELNIGKDS
jgi:hypothetical protein